MIVKWLESNLRSIAMIAIGCAVIAILLLLSQCEDSRRAAREADLNRGQGQAATESGRDAVGTVGAVAGRQAETDRTTRENENEIRNAPGADAPVDPAVGRAGRDSLCRRAAYRGSAECVQRAPAD